MGRHRPKNERGEPHKFKVAPHILEDLGLNLYTSLARVLVEFIANAYDADADVVRLDLPKEKIDDMRREVKDAYLRERQNAENEASTGQIPPLSNRELRDVSIKITDNGHGMTWGDLGQKFLIAGRRRRKEEPDLAGRTAHKKRPLMGRKGLGKLAGFGVAKRVTVISKVRGEGYATKLTLDYDEILTARTTDEVEIPTEKIFDLPAEIRNTASGTMIILSRLMYEPTKNREETISSEISHHFDQIDPKDFRIEYNGEQVAPFVGDFVFAYPNPHILPPDELVERELSEPESKHLYYFKYRIRFTTDDRALPAAKRGIRIYVNHRLAAAPSFLDADTNMQAFRMTDYLDAVVHADFLADEEQDYIATDRQSLLWDTPALSQLREYLSSEIKEACKRYQIFREDQKDQLVRLDTFTKCQVENAPFSRLQKEKAYRIAALLASAHKQGFGDPMYRSVLPRVIQGMGQGEVLAVMRELAEQDQPELYRVVETIARLSMEEMGQFRAIVRGRLDGIRALRKIVVDQNFAATQNEGVLQHLFEQNAWILDPTFAQFICANQSKAVLYRKLAEHLQIGQYATKISENENESERPDLVSLIMGEHVGELVIIELKSSNIPLDSDHLDQLLSYMQTATEWLAANGRGHIRVRGQLIGMLQTSSSRARKVAALRHRLDRWRPNESWEVRTYMDVLTRTEQAHHDMLLLEDDDGPT